MAVIAAGGSSIRMGGGNKLMAEICGIPVLARTLIAFQNHPEIDQIIISAREDMIIPYADLASTFGITKLSHVTAGGADRLESVYKGVLASDEDTDIILVHDGARPLVSCEVISRVIEGVKEHDCAAAAVSVKDTLRLFDESGRKCTLIPREMVRAMQTPQGAIRPLLLKALSYCIENKISVTDDCAALEAIGCSFILTEGSFSNIKITTAEDLVLAEGFLTEEK